jgi:hypothetical protein
MRSEQPPAIATWLLERFCSSPGLAGDLIEEYATRRSALWYWKQAIVAVSVYPFSQILEHKWLAARAIAIGWIIWFVFNNTLLRGVVRPWMAGESTMLKASYFVLGYAVWLANGWIIAKLHRPYSTAMVLAYVLWSLGASVPPLYAAAVGTFDGSVGGASLAWQVAARAIVLLTLMTGGMLSARRDELKGTHTGEQGWRQGSTGVFAAR